MNAKNFPSIKLCPYLHCIWTRIEKNFSTLLSYYWFPCYLGLVVVNGLITNLIFRSIMHLMKWQKTRRRQIKLNNLENYATYIFKSEMKKSFMHLDQLEIDRIHNRQITVVFLVVLWSYNTDSGSSTSVSFPRKKNKKHLKEPSPIFSTSSKFWKFGIIR